MLKTVKIGKRKVIEIIFVNSRRQYCSSISKLNVLVQCVLLCSMFIVFIHCFSNLNVASSPLLFNKFELEFEFEKK